MVKDRPARLGIMGGTFDPVHHGHLVCAEEAAYQFGLDEVIFMPSGDPWHKAAAAGSEDRYRMTELATNDNDHFAVSRAEIDRPGHSYTVDTLRSLREVYGNSVDLFFITGADAVLEILTWKDPSEVLGLARFIAASRPGYDVAPLRRQSLDSKVVFMQIPALAISSTDIRARVAEGRPVRYLVPVEVARYIQEHGLYRGPG